MKTIHMQGIRTQQGLTLIEVMLSITLGLLFLVAAMSFLVSAQQSYRSQDTATRIQENARFAMDMMRGYVRMAGYSDDVTITPAYIYRDGCGTTINGQSSATNCSADTTTVQGDRLALSQLSPDAEDCLGNALGADTHVANVFWVETAAAPSGSGTISSLYCRGWDVDNSSWHSAAQPLVDGIDQMQVQYGVYNAATDSVDRYLNAAGVEALTSGWANVQSVRISLLVNAGVDTSDASQSASTVDNLTFAANYDSFTLLDGALYNPRDNRIRKVFSSTITINNAL